MQSYSKNISFFCLYVSHLLKGGKVGQKIIDNMNAPKTGNIVYISGFKAEVCYWTFFNWVTCNWLTTFWIQHRITRTNLYSLWPLFKKKSERKTLCKCCDIGTCRNYDHIRTQPKKQKDCRADVTWSGSSWKTSFGWIYGHQYHVILAKVLLLFFWKTIHVLVCFFNNTVLLPNKNIQLFHRHKA